MERRVLLAVVLSFLVLYGYQALFPPPPVPPPAQQAPDAAAERQPSAATVTEQQPAVEAPREPAPSPVVAASREQDILFESEAVRAVFSTRGAVLKSWQLKHYRNDAGETLDLVPDRVPDAVRPFSLQTDDPAIANRLNGALFEPSAESVQLGSSPASLRFEYRDSSGLVATKVFTIAPEHPYLIQFTVEVSLGGTPVNPVVRWGPALGSGEIAGGMMYSPPPQPIFYRDGDVTRVSIGDIEEYRSVEGRFGFVGVDDHYFLSAALPAETPLRVTFTPRPIPAAGDDDGLQFIEWTMQYPAPPQNARVFFGPKDFDVLAAIDRDLVRAIDFGIFAWLTVPLLQALKWVNGYVGNYGWSIIVLTVIINLAMFPLRHKSVVSMRKMQEIQPEVKAIQERYSKLKVTDPARQKMNVELMNLYRERGVNPASGCVPMLLTMPVLFAFYSMLSVAIELRGAPFIGWIQDLSTYDPWFVTPIIMGATMVVQQKMTPSTADPMQQRMMMFMPIVFTFMFVWAPSGLVLYWTVSNLWAIGQQAITNKLIGPAPQHAVRPPAERRVKSAGAGRSAQAAKERK